jgi:hypothetical protein
MLTCSMSIGCVAGWYVLSAELQYSHAHDMYPFTTTICVGLRKTVWDTELLAHASLFAGCSVLMCIWLVIVWLCQACVLGMTPLMMQADCLAGGLPVTAGFVWLASNWQLLSPTVVHFWVPYMTWLVRLGPVDVWACLCECQGLRQCHQSFWIRVMHHGMDCLWLTACSLMVI